MTALLILAAVCYGFSGAVTAFLMATPYRLRVPVMFFVVMLWPIVVLAAAAMDKEKYKKLLAEPPIFPFFCGFVGGAIGSWLTLKFYFIG